MVSTIPSITNAGRALLLRAIAGETLTFTRLAIGSGELEEGQDQDELTALIQEELSITPASLDDSQAGLLAISGDFTGADIDEDFICRELGVFAKGEDNIELLYAYSNDGDNSSVMRAISSALLVEESISVVVEIDDAENVTAIFNPHTQYAEATTLAGHMNNTSNPHNVTKAQVGLGNVVNKAPSDMTITFTAASERENISTGEKLSVMFGKIAKVITDVVSHITANTGNPHSVTASDVGLGNVANTSPENTVVTFTQAETRANIASGEKLSVMFGKIMKVIADVITHLAATTGNPHQVTKTDVGLDNVENTAPSFNVINFEMQQNNAVPATGDTMAQIMGKVSRCLTSFMSHIDTTNTVNPHDIKLGQIAVMGTYTGNGAQTGGRLISTQYNNASFNPSAVMVWDEFGRTYNAANGVCGGLALADRGVRVPNSLTTDDATEWDDSFTALMCDEGGFRVGFYTGATAEDSVDTNENGVVYHYIAYK